MKKRHGWNYRAATLPERFRAAWRAFWRPVPTGKREPVKEKPATYKEIISR